MRDEGVRIFDSGRMKQGRINHQTTILVPEGSSVDGSSRAGFALLHPQFDVPHIQRAAHLEFGWLRGASFVWPTWLSELSAPTFSPKVALGHTTEAGLEKHLGKMRATGALT